MKTPRHGPRFRYAIFVLLVLFSTALVAERADYRLVATYPHASGAFTQGFELHGDTLFESSGRYRKSFIARGPLGEEPELIRRLPDNVFAEGLTVLDGRLYLLSWRGQRGFIFDPETFRPLGQFGYHGEGWGLTNDGRRLIMSNGTDVLQFLDPRTFDVVRRLPVTYRGQPVRHINELAWHDGLIVANHWQHDHLLVIDAESGEVLRIIDLSDLYPRAERAPGTDVLNGVTHDPASDTWLVTGKLWPLIYRLELALPARH